MNDYKTNQRKILCNCHGSPHVHEYDYDYDYDYEISLFGHRRKKTNTKVS